MMNGKSKHAPGPWEYRQANPQNGFTRSIRASDSTGVAIISNRLDVAVIDANAHLIAAAPEMLEALEALVTHFSGEIYSGSGTEDNQLKLQALRNIIAKAKGQTSQVHQDKPVEV